MMKMLKYILLFLMLVLYARGQEISYIIPDIGAPDMNVYVEFVAPVDDFGAFGADGFYDNNPSSLVKIETVNPDDAWKVVFGPVVVSWNGRLISTQAFIHPSLQPREIYWRNLDPEFVVPVRVTVNGNPTNSQNFYIVKPYHFGDISGLAERVLGEGSLGRRSARGAMIIDSAVFADAEYTVSMQDCDPDSPGNQAYLPFVLLSTGKMTGSANTTINVNGGIRTSNKGGNGGPGGGGGGGRFVDRKFGSERGDDGGDGFVGGGKGGENYNLSGGGNYREPGTGTGYKSGQSDASGYSMNGIAPPVHSGVNFEASGGGTGHPFGMAGRCTGHATSDNPEGGYGGGSGYRDASSGGCGGYATEGAKSNTSARNGGKVHGNIMTVPIAGGSGGASGNPNAGLFDDRDYSGSGGGGGGAIRIFAPYMDNITITADGGKGDNSQGDDDKGGGGSGGHISVNTKIDTRNIKLSAYGPLTGSSQLVAGAGRLRMDIAGNISQVTVLNPESSKSDAPVSYRGLTTDTSRTVERNLTLTGTKQSDKSCMFYYRGESGNWTPLPAAAQPGNDWTLNFNLVGDDTLYYFYAMQNVPSPSTQNYEYEPMWVLSQAAANIFHIPPVPEIDGEDSCGFVTAKCIGSEVTDTFFITNIGKANLILRLDSVEYMLNTPGFELLSPTVVTVVEPGDTVDVIMKYTYQDGQSEPITDTLLIPHNDLKTDLNPWKVSLTVDLKDIDFISQNTEQTKTFGNTYDEGLYLGQICIDATIDTIIAVVSKSEIPITLLKPVTEDLSILNVLSVKTLMQNTDDTVHVKVSYTADVTTPGEYIGRIIFGISECDDYKDTVLVRVDVVQADLQFVDYNEHDTVDIGSVCIGEEKAVDIDFRNESIEAVEVEALIDDEANFSAALTGNTLLDPGDVGTLQVSFIALTEGEFITRAVVFTYDCGYDADTIYIRAKGVSSEFEISGNGDFGDVRVGKKDTLEFILTNTGSGNVFINTLPALNPPFRILDAVPQPPALIIPGETLVFKVEFAPQAETSYSEFAKFISEAIGDACPYEDSVLLTGKGIKSHIELSKFALDFGLIPTCLTALDTVVIRNSGSASFKITNHEITGADAQYFEFVSKPNLPHTLNPNGEFAYIIRFNPVGSPDGVKLAEFIITTDDPEDSELRIPMQGENEDIKLTVPNNLVFDAMPVGSNQTKIVTVVNNSSFDVNIISVSSDNPDVTITPQSATVAASSSQAFDVTMQYTKAGDITATLHFAIDTPCEKDYYVDVYGAGLEGDISYNTLIDYGTLAPCHTKTDSVVITNTGQLDVDITNMQIVGADAALFEFVDAFTPVTLAEDESYVRLVRFVPQNSTDGIKEAEVRTTVVINSETQTLTTFLHGERLSGLLAFPQSVEFGTVQQNTVHTKTVKISNVGQQPITLENILSPLSTPIFELVDNISNFDLLPNQSINLTIRFTPPTDSCYSDEIIINYSVSGCDEQETVALSGCGAKPGGITLILPKLENVEPYLDNYLIPVMAFCDDIAESVYIESLSIDIAFDGYLYLPTLATAGQITSNVLDNRTRKITIDLNSSGTIYRDTTLVTYIRGYTLLGDITYTDLMFTDVRVTGAQGTSIGTVNVVHGSLEVEICEEGGARLLTNSEPLKMSINPNPAGDKLNVEMFTLEKGQHTLSIITLTGEQIVLDRWSEQRSSSEQSKEYETSDLSSGMYYLRLAGPNSFVVVPLMIVK